MKKLITSMLLAAAIVSAGDACKGAPTPLHASQAPQGLMFIENKGQIVDQRQQPRKDIQFSLKGQGMSVFIGEGQIHYQFNNAGDKKATQITTSRTDVTLEGANTHAKVIAAGPQVYTEKYYTSANGGSADVAHTYKKITYKNVYPGIDWVLYIKNNKLEYDFVVRPGANLADIKMKYAGANALNIGKDGSLHITTPMGSIKELAPSSYIQTTSEKVASSFALNNNVLSFHTAPYRGTLIIDPTLEWGTYYASSAGASPGANAYVACDSAGNVYMATATFDNFYVQTNLATTGSYQDTFGLEAFATEHACLVKFNSAGQRLWATYYGYVGTGITSSGVACDNAGNVYLAGTTANPDSTIVTPGAYLTSFGGVTTNPYAPAGNAFLAKFDGNGNRLWGTYYSGNAMSTATAVSCDNSGNVYLSGTTNEQLDTNNLLGTPGTFQPYYAVAAPASFVAKFNSAGQRVWGTYLACTGILASSCDVNGDLYVGGAIALDNEAFSISEPLIASPGSFQDTVWNGASVQAGPQSDISSFLIKLNGTSGQRLWGTFYGSGTIGSGTEITGIATDATANVYIAGIVDDEPDTFLYTANAYQPYFGGGNFDAFVGKFNSTGKRIWGTLYGGSLIENNTAIACDPLGNVYIGGYTTSLDGIATAGSYDTAIDIGTFNGYADAYLAELDSSGQHRLWGTYYGGEGDDLFTGLACDHLANLYVAGNTSSDTGIATPGAFDTANTPVGEQYYNTFLAKFHNCVLPPATITALSPVAICSGDSVLFASASPGAYTYQWQNSGVSIAGATNPAYAATTPGAYSLILGNPGCANTDTSAADTVMVHPLPTPVITIQGNVLGTGSYLSYQWFVGNNIITNATAQTYKASANDTFYVVVTDSNGCSKKSAPYVLTDLSVSSVSALANRVSVYPNPATSIVYIDAPVSVNVSLSGVDGRTVLQQNNAVRIDINNLANGMYLLRITDNNGTLIKMDKIVKVAQ